MVLTGFIPEKLPVVRNFLVQVAAGFVSIVAPAAVGGVALNTRYLQKQGIGTGPAVSAVGASQAVGFIMHIALIAAFSPSLSAQVAAGIPMRQINYSAAPRVDQCIQLWPSRTMPL